MLSYDSDDVTCRYVVFITPICARASVIDTARYAVSVDETAFKSVWRGWGWDGAQRSAARRLCMQVQCTRVRVIEDYAPC